MIVLDSSAILALMKGETGGSLVAPHLGAAMICAPNVTEVVTRLIDNKMSPSEAVAAFSSLSIVVVPLDASLALRAGELRAVTVRQGLSLGDRACLALAERERLAVVTADRAWTKLDLGIDIQLIR